MAEEREGGMPPAGRTNGMLVAVVVTYNRLHQLKITVPRLLEAAPDQLEALIVVDNASTDGTHEWLLAQKDGRLRAIVSPENLGGAGGFNLGLRRAMELYHPDWVVVMDDDARPAPGALAAFHATDLTGWDAAAAAVYYPSGEICEMNRPSMNPFRTPLTFARYSLGLGDHAHLPPAAYRAGPRAVDWATFVGLFLSREAIGRIGYPDPRLFIYSDDVLYTLGLSAAGRLGFFPEITFEHDCSSLSSGSSRRLSPLWKTYYYHRNQILLYRALTGHWFWLVIWLFIAKWALKLRHHKGVRREFLKLFWWGVRDGLARRLDRPVETIFAAAKGL